MTRINRDGVVISYDLFRVGEEEETESTEDLEEVIGAVKELVRLDQLTPKESDKVTEVAKKIFTSRNELAKTHAQMGKLIGRLMVITEDTIELYEGALKSRFIESSLKFICERTLEILKTHRQVNSERLEIVKDLASTMAIIRSTWIDAELSFPKEASLSLRVEKFVYYGEEGPVKKIESILKLFPEGLKALQFELNEMEVGFEQSKIALIRAGL